MYFCIARIWGDAPLELEPTESSNKPKLAREPAEEVLARALSDVNTAIDLFRKKVMQMEKEGHRSRHAMH